MANVLNWFEIPVTHFDRAKSFYEKVLDIAIEPMVTEGHYAVETLEDGWTVVTKDRKSASHYEDTIAFMENGFMNLTGDEVL